MYLLSNNSMLSPVQRRRRAGANKVLVNHVTNSTENNYAMMIPLSVGDALYFTTRTHTTKGILMKSRFDYPGLHLRWKFFVFHTNCHSLTSK